VEVFWYFPTQGDERYLGSPLGRRESTYPYMRQVAMAVDHLGFDGMLIGTGQKQDTWVVATALMTATEQLRFLLAIRPSLMTPAASVRMASTFDRISNGRILLNIVTGGSDADSARDGVLLSHDERYAHTDEFLTIWRALMRGEDVTFQGRHLSISGGKLAIPPVQRPYPPLYFGGSSPAALEVAARHVDVYLTWGEPPAQVAEKIATVRRLAAREGRTIRFGIRLHIIVRETAEKAWQAAEDLICHLDDETIAKAQQFQAASQSEGQRRMMQLHGGRRDQLEISPNLWAGPGLVRGGCGTALVGDPETIAGRMREYYALGIDTFVFSGYPALEESYYVAELLFPLLARSRQTAQTTRLWNVPTPTSLAQIYQPGG
jgi:alkanesulfonate monooxygenase